MWLQISSHIQGLSHGTGCRSNSGHLGELGPGLLIIVGQLAGFLESRLTNYQILPPVNI